VVDVLANWHHTSWVPEAFNGLEMQGSLWLVACRSLHFQESGFSALLMAARCRLLGPRRQPISRKNTTALHPTMLGSPRHSALAPASDAYVNTMPLHTQHGSVWQSLMFAAFSVTGTLIWHQLDSWCDLGGTVCDCSPNAAVHAR
jgi:hypothetical protein